MKLNDIENLQLTNSERQSSRKFCNFRAGTFFDFALLCCKGSSTLTADVLNNNNKSIRKSKETSTSQIETSLKNTHQFN